MLLFIVFKFRNFNVYFIQMSLCPVCHFLTLKYTITKRKMARMADCFAAEILDMHDVHENITQTSYHTFQKIIFIKKNIHIIKLFLFLKKYASYCYCVIFHLLVCLLRFLNNLRIHIQVNVPKLHLTIYLFWILKMFYFTLLNRILQLLKLLGNMISK